jgi:hypothetical protein
LNIRSILNKDALRVIYAILPLVVEVINYDSVSSEVLKTVIIKITVFLDVKACSLVYNYIKCADCAAICVSWKCSHVYIGQTGCSNETRLKEHHGHIQMSAVAKPSVNSNTPAFFLLNLEALTVPSGR